MSVYVLLMYIQMFVFFYLWFCFFFFKQKTAYEMRISDWSLDVCSSDLPAVLANAEAAVPARASSLSRRAFPTSSWKDGRRLPPHTPYAEIGRASCRERVCQYV